MPRGGRPADRDLREPERALGGRDGDDQFEIIGPLGFGERGVRFGHEVMQFQRSHRVSTR
jgi:hypothetical protein